MPTAKSKRALDGDTFEIMDSTAIRASGCDVPKLDQRGGKAAKQKLPKLIRGKTIGISKELSHQNLQTFCSPICCLYSYR